MRITHPLPAEELRLQDLYSYQILDTGEEADFTDLIDLVTQIYGCPMAALTFVDKNRLWFKAIKGIDAKQAPREGSPCDYAVAADEVFIVQDLLKDERFANNELLTGVLKLRFYAGAPVISAAGYKLGTVCIYDHRPRRLSQNQCIGLKAIANQVNKLLQLNAKNRLIKEQAADLLLTEKKLTQSILQGQEKERLSIGTELHENIAQGLAATKLYLDTVSQSVDHPFLKKSGETVSQLLQQVRELSYSIVPTTLQSAGFKNLLQILVDRYQAQYHFAVSFVYTGGDDFASDLSLALYRMVEEAFENVRKHASAQEIMLQVTVTDVIVINIGDDGKGLNLQAFTKGQGLGSIASVTEYYHGSVDLVSDGKNGCTLTLQVPLNKKRQGA